MSRMIFVNLPVTDLPRSMKFYESLGFTNEKRFTDETAACMVWSEAIFVMLLTHAKWATFTTRPIPSSDSSEVALALVCESKDEVHKIADAAAANAGIAEINPTQDHGFMFTRSFGDPDGHVWEVFWMDPAVANGEVEVPEVTV
jgi:predicted lactoylglutathione lyase